MIVISWAGNDQVNDGINYAMYFVGPGLGLPEMQVNSVARHGAHPLIGGVTRQGLELLAEVEVLAGSADVLRALFDNEDETPKELVVADENGGNPRYWNALPASFTPTTTPYIFLVKLRVHGDVRARAVTPTTDSWNITSSGATKAVTNGAAGVNDDAYPILTLTSRQLGAVGNSYSRFLTVRWRNSYSALNYPVDVADALLDTRTASTNFYSAAGNDIRLMVDGVEADYWLHGINTATTRVWTNLNWQPKGEAPLSAGIGSGALASITVAGSVSAFPNSGILEIDSELLTYTGKDNTNRQFTGISRGAKGTTAAVHSAGATVRWIQHELWIEYGSDALAAITTDDRYKPIFTLASSSNTTWDYDAFYENGASRAGAWAFANSENTAGYGGNQATAANPYAELGINSTVTTTKRDLNGVWSFYNPCGITGANFANGQFYHGRADWWQALVRLSVSGTSYVTEYSLPSGANGAWVAWSQNVTPAAGSRYVQLALLGNSNSAFPMRVEAADVTVTLDSNNTPSVTIGAEQTTYRMVATITNETTGDAILVDFGLDMNESLEINTDTDEVTYLTDGSAQYQTVTQLGSVRHHMLRLAPGANTLRYDEEGVTEVDIDIEFEKRFRA